MKRLNFFMSIFLTASLTLHAYGETAIRTDEVSESEFQSLSKALGHTTVSEASRSAPVDSGTFEIFKARLIAAQAEWLKRKELAAGTFPAGLRLLDMRFDADWTSEEREAFVTIYRRLIAEGNLSAELRERLQTELRDFQLTEDASLDARSWLRFPSELPLDVNFVLVNGTPKSRLEVSTMRFPRSRARVTLLSNLYRTTTLLLDGTESDWPLRPRERWVSDTCRINPVADRDLGSFVILGSTRCQLPDRPEVVKDFMKPFSPSSNVATKDLLPVAPAPRTSIVQKPWFWGALAAVAVGAVVVSLKNRADEPAAIRPVNHEGW